jgi:myosin-crossreactive antigen
MAPADRASDPSALARNGADRSKVYLVGGGIASMAAAAFMIRDGDMPGHNITILEELGKLGGSLDCSGSPQSAHVLRGDRMFEGKYLCTYELFSSVPRSTAARRSRRRSWRGTRRWRRRPNRASSATATGRMRPNSASAKRIS